MAVQMSSHFFINKFDQKKMRTKINPHFKNNFHLKLER